MNSPTRNILVAALAADSSISRETATAALSLLEGRGGNAAPMGRVIRTSEACKLFGVTSKTLRLWALRGALVPVFGGQNKRRCGYTEASVRQLLRGKGGER